MEERQNQRKTLSIKQILRPLQTPALAIITALIIGAVVMLLSGDNPLRAYYGLARGAFGSSMGWAKTIRKMTPFIFTGLSVAFAFKAGLFNIGASGQFMMGTVAAVAVGINFEGLPFIIHMPLAMLAGMIGGAVWGAIPGLLKVWRGTHEVITTIMLNYVASLLASWMVYAGGTQGQKPGPLSDPEAAASAISETKDVLVSARIPFIFAEPYKVHWGIIIALITAAVIWWLLFKTTIGYEIRTVGLNTTAAKYAGMKVGRTIVTTMAIAGLLAGMAGAVETLGLNHKFAPEFTGSAGFDGITVALLGKTHPVGVVLSALLIGGMNGGAAKMQFDSGVPAEIIQVVQALVLAFIAAPEIIRIIYRYRSQRAIEAEAEAQLSTGLGS
ncbi:MAG: ABC transporter permease [Chloroflexota bacterium]